MNTANHPSFKRARDAVHASGSRASTLTGILAYLRADRGSSRRNLRSLVAPVGSKRAKEDGRLLAVERYSISRYRRTQLERITRDITDEMRTYARYESGAHSSCPIVIVDGPFADRGPTLEGEGFWHRWRGKWKTAPGSYQPSTQRVIVGAQWLRDRRPEYLWIDGTRTLVPATRIERDGYTIRPNCYVAGRDCTLVAQRGRFYHSHSSDIDLAIAEARKMWTAQDEKRRRTSDLTRVWVTADDSTRAGNCQIGTDAQREIVERKLRAVGTIGAVRADVLLRMRDDAFTRRAVDAAAMRLGD